MVLEFTSDTKMMGSCSEGTPEMQVRQWLQSTSLLMMLHSWPPPEPELKDRYWSMYRWPVTFGSLSVSPIRKSCDWQ